MIHYKNNTSKIYYKDNEINKAYYGNNLVFANNPYGEPTKYIENGVIINTPNICSYYVPDGQGHSRTQPFTWNRKGVKWTQPGADTVWCVVSLNMGWYIGLILPEQLPEKCFLFANGTVTIKQADPDNGVTNCKLSYGDNIILQETAGKDLTKTTYSFKIEYQSIGNITWIPVIKFDAIGTKKGTLSSISGGSYISIAQWEITFNNLVIYKKE